jgi:3-methyl-2-oxobutanoate hydroxymethyltransferase
MLGIYPGKKARFVRNFMENSTSIEHAIKRYIQDVKTGAFPAPEHCF